MNDIDKTGYTAELEKYRLSAVAFPVMIIGNIALTVGHLLWYKTSINDSPADPGVFRYTIALDILLVAMLFISVMVVRFLLKHSENPVRKIKIIVHVAILTWMAIVFGHTYMAGVLTSVLPLAIPATGIVVVWILDRKVALFYFLLGSLGLVVMVTLTMKGILPYAPLFKTAAHVTKYFLSPFYATSSLMFYFLISSIILLSFGLFERERERKNRKLAKAYQSISHALEVVMKVAEGNMDAANRSIEQMNAMAGEMEQEQEARMLLGAINDMIENLNSLMNQVNAARSHVKQSSIRIVDMTGRMEKRVKNQADPIDKSQHSAEDISKVSDDLTDAMGGINSMAGETAQLADTGHAGLQGMAATIQGLAGSTGSISSRLSLINEKANNVTSIITTIVDVANQINLLSLNAAVESESAGEFGRGFSVVAARIRTLADQTAKATLDIEQMVREMQSSVSAGVMEMDKFTEQIRSGIELANNTGLQLENIIGNVQNLTPRFETINEGIRSQSVGAKRINDMLKELSATMRSTIQKIREFKQTNARLNETVRGLEEKTSLFKTVDSDKA